MIVGPSCPMRPLRMGWRFIQPVSKFQYACSEAEVQEEHLLREACKLLSLLTKVADTSCAADRAEVQGVQLGSACAEATERLSTLVDTVGLQWLKKLMTDSNCGDRAAAIEKAKKIFNTSSSFLADCIQTCSLFCGDDLKGVQIGGRMADLVALVPLFIKTISVKDDLMKQLSEDCLYLCQKFAHDYEEKLQEQVRTLTQNFVQLRKLEEKYQYPGFCFRVVLYYIIIAIVLVY